MLRIAFMVSIFVFSFISKNHVISKYDTYLVRAAIFFALFADCFLIINDVYEIYPIGILSFCVCHLLNYFRFTDKKTFIRSAPILPVIFLLLPSSLLDLVTRVSIIFILCLLLASYGAIRAFKNKKYPSPNSYFIVLAMLFFFIADINVLLYNMEPLFDYRLYTLYGIWIFTLPAHILLNLSRIKLKS